jgi:hypothetical protein
MFGSFWNNRPNNFSCEKKFALFFWEVVFRPVDPSDTFSIFDAKMRIKSCVLKSLLGSAAGVDFTINLQNSPNAGCWSYELRSKIGRGGAMAANHWDAPEKYQDESSQANAPFGRVDPVDLELRSATQNKNFHANPPEEQLLFAWLLSILFALGNLDRTIMRFTVLIKTLTNHNPIKLPWKLWYGR